MTVTNGRVHSLGEAWGENPEAWGENPEAWGENPEAWGENPEAWGENPEAWGENPEAWGENPEAWGENPEAWEADRFLPLIPLAMKALPSLARVAMPAIRRMLPIGRRIAGQVARRVLGGGRPARPPMQPGGWTPPQPGRVPPSPPVPRPGGWAPPTRPGGWGPPPPLRPGPWGPPARRRWTRRRRVTVAGLLRQLADILGDGEAEAAQLEASLFGANAMNGELAANEMAHEAALTEVMAAEATHTASESEAEALLGAALPITITIMGGSRAVRPVFPSLVQANRRLVRGIRTSGPAGQQLLRVVPAIQRRTIATLRAAARSGQPITPQLATRVMAGHAARVLSTPRVCGPALVRNAAIRHTTVASAGRPVARPRHRMAEY
jgi:hypothetical protein